MGDVLLLKGLPSHAQVSSLYILSLYPQHHSCDKIPQAVYTKVGQVKVNQLLFYVAYTALGPRLVGLVVSEIGPEQMDRQTYLTTRVTLLSVHACNG